MSPNTFVDPNLIIDFQANFTLVFVVTSTFVGVILMNFLSIAFEKPSLEIIASIMIVFNILFCVIYFFRELIHVVRVVINII